MYELPGVRLESDLPLDAFAPFLTEDGADLPLVTLHAVQQSVPTGGVRFTASQRGIVTEQLENGWRFSRSDWPGAVLDASADYRSLTLYLPEYPVSQDQYTPLIRTALECASIRQGVMSVHSASVLLDGEAVCFSAPSGTGKSTRAVSWQSALGAELISGDRPAIRLTKTGGIVCGVPWDGKECHYRNIRAPLKALCMLRRGDFTRVRRLSPAQIRRELMHQCFIPMWDTDTAAEAMMLVSMMARRLPVYRVICGPDGDAARALREILYHHPEEIREIEEEMKIKNGFTLRNLADEYVVMPTGENITKFDGTIVLSEVAAFVWQKLTQGATRSELADYILAEYEIDRATAERDLDALLAKLRSYGVLDDC